MSTKVRQTRRCNNQVVRTCLARRIQHRRRSAVNDWDGVRMIHSDVIGVLMCETDPARGLSSTEIEDGLDAVGAWSRRLPWPVNAAGAGRELASQRASLSLPCSLQGLPPLLRGCRHVLVGSGILATRKRTLRNGFVSTPQSCPRLLAITCARLVSTCPAVSRNPTSTAAYLADSASTTRRALPSCGRVGSGISSGDRSRAGGGRSG